MPEGVNCAPASELYNLADKPEFQDGISGQKMQAHRNSTEVSGAQVSDDRAGDLSRRGSGRTSGKGDTREAGAAPGYFGREPLIPAGDPDHLLLLNPPAADPTDPMRTQAVQQRVWIAPWVNQRGVWHGQQVIYVEISSREWQNGIIGGEPSMPIFKPLD